MANTDESLFQSKAHTSLPPVDTVTTGVLPLTSHIATLFPVSVEEATI